jgi:hypothetical protein
VCIGTSGRKYDRGTKRKYAKEKRKIKGKLKSKRIK